MEALFLCVTEAEGESLWVGDSSYSERKMRCEREMEVGCGKMLSETGWSPDPLLLTEATVWPGAVSRGRGVD